MNDIKQKISTFNIGRDDEILKLKYQRMSENSSRFFRGTCHLYYQDIAENAFLANSPKVWICGDLHLENFGSFTGSDGICYFDINDFDESILAPLLWDVSRIMVSIVVFGRDLKLKEKQIQNLLNQFFDVYIANMMRGKSLILHQKTAHGEIADLLKKVSTRSANYLLKTKTEKKEKFIIEDEKTYKLPKEFRRSFTDLIQEKLATHENFNSYQILDVVGRIAGTGSLGLPRYLVLIYSKKEKNTLILDLKTARESSLKKYTNVVQPKWNSEAERICFAQDLLQYHAPNLLESWKIAETNYVVRDYQPSEDKIDWFSIADEPENLKNIISDFAKILAWSQIRACGRNDADNYDTIFQFIENQTIKSNLLNFVNSYSEKVKQDFDEFLM